MTRTCQSLVVAGSLMLLVCPRTALGQTIPAVAPAPAPVTTELRTQLGVSYNNLGLQQSLEWTRKAARLTLGAQVAVSPSYARVHAWAQYTPAPVLTIRVGVEPAQYFGTFNSLMPFDALDQPFDTDSRKDRGGARADRAIRAYVTPTLRMRVRRLIGLASYDFELWRAWSPGKFFYEPTRDTLLASRGDGLGVWRGVLMYEHTTSGATRIAVGGIHTFQHRPAFRDAYTPLRIQRAGLITSIQSDTRLLGLRRPTITATVGRYLDDPSKKKGWTATLTIAATVRRR